MLRPTPVLPLPFPLLQLQLQLQLPILLMLLLLLLLRMLLLKNPVLRPTWRQGQGRPTKPKLTPTDEAVNQKGCCNFEDEKCNYKDKLGSNRANAEDTATNRRGRHGG